MVFGFGGFLLVFFFFSFLPGTRVNDQSSNIFNLIYHTETFFLPPIKHVRVD